MNAELHQEPSQRHASGPRRRKRSSTADRNPAPASDAAMLYLRPVKYPEPLLQFYSFDATYVARLRKGDAPTEEHFVAYFSTFIHGKLRSRLRSPQAVEDVRQETFLRVLKLLREDGLRHPERLGACVNMVCNNVLKEHYRQTARSDSLDDEGQPELAASGADALQIASSNELKVKVREILEAMPEKDRRVLSAIFLEERDRDEVCLEMGVERGYLRVLLLRSKLVFKLAYLKLNQYPTAREMDS